ncbi:hypothetical protein KYC_18445 [Achromobacter arsenitoxydans SY8]|uniref:Uncharacterized protein n=1 Tax=Achromobacter arsenitoxydans SY8 TaxID=477184 RepID=H0FA11_9BURK|nr:hypothetical protein KYC_18445 [Achromobacter arsenitoxydans SY8]
MVIVASVVVATRLGMLHRIKSRQAMAQRDMAYG